MKKAVVYYSFGGTTKAYAEKRAQQEQADLLEIKPLKKYNIFTAFLFGCPMARKQQAVLLQEHLDLSEYDEITLAFPVWAGLPVPCFNSAVNMVPQGKKVSVVLLSGGKEAQSCTELVTKFIEQSGLELTEFEHVQVQPNKG